jgi:uncharacterized protein YeaO (DUF488 family)
MVLKGKLYTSNLAGLKKTSFDADVLLITRAGVELPGAEIIRDLSPSKDLFQKYLSLWKDQGDYSWWPSYEQRFMIELKSNEKLNALRYVYKRLLQGENIVLVCFCKDHRYCHRRLVGEFFEKYDMHVEELNPVKYEQITLF